MIRALVFDFDGLILDTETPLIDAYAAVHEQHGVAFDRSLFIRSVGHADYAFDPWHGFSPHADRAGLELQRRAAKDDFILQQPVLPGILALLEAARTAGLRIGLASNSPHSWCDAHLSRLGLLSHFHHVGCREDVPSPKPEPDLYRLAVNRLGVRPHEAVAFEDSQAGTLAARRAGMKVVAVPNPSTAHHDFSNADVRLASLAETSLPDLIVRFAGQDQ
jgi:HAD superfamily hydrolase (TIGR01509 family)